MNRVQYIEVNSACNNSCIGCAVAPHNGWKKPLSDVKREIDAGCRDYGTLHIIGGEVLLHPQVFEMLDYAAPMYNEIAITTNGRLISSAGLSRFPQNTAFALTLCGPNAQVHEAWTQVKGSFSQSIGGAQKLLASGRKVCLNLLMWKRALENLEPYLALIRELRPVGLGILCLGPFGRCREKYLELAPGLSDCKKLNKFLREAKGLAKSIDVEDFPLCIFDRQLLESIHFQDISSSLYRAGGVIETLGLFSAREKGYSLSSTQLNCSGITQDDVNVKEKLPACTTCRHECKGIYTEYIKQKGRDNVNQEVLLL